MNSSRCRDSSRRYLPSRTRRATNDFNPRITRPASFLPSMMSATLFIRFAVSEYPSIRKLASIDRASARARRLCRSIATPPSCLLGSRNPCGARTSTRRAAPRGAAPHDYSGRSAAARLPPALGALDGFLERLAGLEAGRLAGRDLDALAGPGLDAGARLALADLERAEARDRDALPLGELRLDAVEDGVHGGAGLLLVEARGAGYVVD